MIKVYFQSETGSHSELVATFRTDEMYQHFIPMLEHLAAKQRCIVTETMSEHSIDEAVASETQAVGFSCLKWHEEDFNKSRESMNEFFKTHNEVIIQNINELITSFDFDDFRECSNCGSRNFSEEYVFRGGENYACCEVCRDSICEKVYNTTWEEEYTEDGDSYYTEFP